MKIQAITNPNTIKVSLFLRGEQKPDYVFTFHLSRIYVDHLLSELRLWFPMHLAVFELDCRNFEYGKICEAVSCRDMEDVSKLSKFCDHISKYIKK